MVGLAVGIERYDRDREVVVVVKRLAEGTRRLPVCDSIELKTGIGTPV